MRKFTPVTVNREPKDDLALYENFLELEGRVYQLEKELEVISIIVHAAALVGLYFAYRYYQKNISSIPGVQS